MLDKSRRLPVDVVMLDLEDGVVEARKDEARSLVAAALQHPHNVHEPRRYVRINGPEARPFQRDIDAIVPMRPHGLVVPKVEFVDQVRSVDDAVAKCERAAGIDIGGVELVLAIESAQGLLVAAALAAAVPRVSALMFGAEDYSRDLGLPTIRTGVAREFIHARSTIVVAAAAARVQSVDGVWPDLADNEGLERDAALARALGFTGKSMIHPGQAEVVNRVFGPRDEDVCYAERLITAFEDAVAKGEGSIRFEGVLVDRPIFERARRTIALARERALTDDRKEKR